MTVPAHAARGDRWYLRPRVAFPVIGAAVVLTALLAPDQVAGRTGNSRLSTYSNMGWARMARVYSVPWIMLTCTWCLQRFRLGTA